MLEENLVEQPLAFRSQADLDGSSVFCVWNPLDEPFFGKIIDNNCHIAAAHKLFLAQVTERHGSKVTETFKHAELRRRQPERPYILVGELRKRGMGTGQFHPETERRVNLLTVLFCAFHLNLNQSEGSIASFRPTFKKHFRGIIGLRGLKTQEIPLMSDSDVPAVLRVR